MSKIKSLEEYQERVRGWERRVAPYTKYVNSLDFVFYVVFTDYNMAEFFAAPMDQELCLISPEGYPRSPTNTRQMSFTFYSGSGLRPYTLHTSPNQPFETRHKQTLDRQKTRTDNIRTVERWFEINAPGVNPWVREVL